MSHTCHEERNVDQQFCSHLLPYSSEACFAYGGVSAFAPADEIDPAYGEALREAARGGVELLAYSARVRPDRLEIHRRLPIAL